MIRSQKWWDLWYLGLAKYISTASKDPSTKVGAVIVNMDRTPVSWGYNGFPMNVEDHAERYEERDIKYLMVCHAEQNAIIFAHCDLQACTLYTTFSPCARCAGIIIQSGIDRVVTTEPSADLKVRWAKDLNVAAQMFKEAGVELSYVREE